MLYFTATLTIVLWFLGMPLMHRVVVQTRGGFKAVLIGDWIVIILWPLAMLITFFLIAWRD